MKITTEFLIIIGGLGVSAIGLIGFYGKNILTTSRCETCECCCIKIRNKPITSEMVVEYDRQNHDLPNSIQMNNHPIAQDSMRRVSVNNGQYGSPRV